MAQMYSSILQCTSIPSFTLTSVFFFSISRFKTSDDYVLVADNGGFNNGFAEPNISRVELYIYVRETSTNVELNVHFIIHSPNSKSTASKFWIRHRP